MIERGRDFIQQYTGAREKIARLCDPFIMDDMTVLTHSRWGVAAGTEPLSSTGCAKLCRALVYSGNVCGGCVVVVQRFDL